MSEPEPSLEAQHAESEQFEVPTIEMLKKYAETGACPWCGCPDMQFTNDEGFESGEAWIPVECPECQRSVQELYRQYAVSGDGDSVDVIYTLPEPQIERLVEACVKFLKQWDTGNGRIMPYVKGLREAVRRFKRAQPPPSAESICAPKEKA